MHRFIRFSLSGIIGMMVVASLIILMSLLIQGNNVTTTETSLLNQKVKFETIKPKLYNQPQPVKAKQAKKSKPNLQQTPVLELTETGLNNSAKGISFSNKSWGVESEYMGDIFGDIDGTENGAKPSHGGLYKIYEHNFRFPDKARKAGIVKGKIDVRARFTAQHDFIRFEIIHEEPLEFFRDVLYQFDFSKNRAKHLKHRSYQHSFKHSLRDADSEYVYTYRFLFDSQSTEPIRFYMSTH